MTAKPKKSTQELRKFGWTMTIALGIITGLLWWRDKATWIYFLEIASAFLVLAMIFPRALWPIEWVWMKFAHYLSLVVTFIIMVLTFYMVITPVGLFMRMFDKDLLSLKLNRKANTYWIPVEIDGPGSRADKPY